MINIERNLDPKLITAKHKKKKSAFTLIELIVVIAIIAILAAALTPSFTGYINEAKKVAVINQAKNVVTAYESAKVKSSNTYTLDTTVDTFADGSALLDPKDVNKLSNTSIGNCYSIVNTEKYDITLKDNGTFNALKSISSTSTPTE
ncbi:MAG: prepilin-type N-terminal cleavage/methylation domain-containing protein [Clostridium sp.]|uniref:prepilin-type N-terminal cleavage/methylation domain-containing protein n=1 Tax=Clostridium sp. TaxID=1506 RepID=UPI00267349D0|nr:prepilin-type N-terminal cleavage/methylation domain-containing protein [Clostridium sp.]MDD7682586.1 prepilin-type N-terminal cleavage/methylation domain-containing protein [Clostridium sp.]MDY2581111.1 prepilin-type N-terminal cleavage/methylation domain-containing protein [Clostridium sp.]